MNIDSHQHFWKFDPVRDAWINDDMKVIRRDFLPEDLLPILNQNDIHGCVAVQADQSEIETNFLLNLAEDNNFIKGVVGWVDLMHHNLEQRLEYFSANKKLKGFRHIAQGQPKGFLLQESFIRGVTKLREYNFTYDLLIYHNQLEEALQFLGKVADVRIVIDHIAKPSIKTGEKTHWELNMAAAATYQNVFCKVSGMVTEANWKNWSQGTFDPYLDEVFEAFGTKRIMYGSDWPVCLVAASYEQQKTIITNYIAALSEDERRDIMGRNAIKFYNLELPNTM